MKWDCFLPKFWIVAFQISSKARIADYNSFIVKYVLHILLLSVSTSVFLQGNSENSCLKNWRGHNEQPNDRTLRVVCVYTDVPAIALIFYHTSVKGVDLVMLKRSSPSLIFSQLVLRCV